MVFLSILEFSLRSNCRYMRSVMSSTTATMETTTSVEATSKARPPARRKASDIATVIKATEWRRAGSWLKVRSRRSVEPRPSVARPASVERVAMVEVAVIEVVVVEVVAIDDRSAVGDVGVVVVDYPVAMPVASPMMPAPPVSSEETDAEPDSKSDPRSGKEDSRLGIPAWICDDRLAIYEPGIISRNINDLRVGWFDDDGVALSRYLLLFIAIEVAGAVSLLTHCLDGIRHILLLVGVGVAERRSPGKVLVHVFKNRGKLCESLHTRVPRLFVDFVCQLSTLEVGMALHPP